MKCEDIKIYQNQQGVIKMEVIIVKGITGYLR